MANQDIITIGLAHQLIINQFPQYAHLPIKEVAISGADNKTFHLGENMLMRLPRAQEYAASVFKEQKWLPILAPKLPFEIPTPLNLGCADEGYSYHWSIYSYIEGETVAVAKNINMNELAIDLAKFICALHLIDITDGPLPDVNNFAHINGLSFYDHEVCKAVMILKDKIPHDLIMKIWQSGLHTKWQRAPLWCHGDIAAGNILCKKGKLCAVIDFEGLAIGDPACDLVIAWKFFSKSSRKVFRENLLLDDDTWARARSWALWKALIVEAKICESNYIETKYAWPTIQEVINDFV